MELGSVYRHNSLPNFIRLVKIRKNGFNTFVEVDENNNVILQKRKWSSGVLSEQARLIKGFEKLKLITQLQKH